MAGKTVAGKKPRSGATPPVGLEVPSAGWAVALQERLLAWYQREKRDLPWRHSRDPYHIWVSEAMLQQTRVETVIPYYERFLAWFPTVGALAQAPEEQVLKAWEGLGYYARARHLQAAAREVEARYGGRVPDDPTDFGTLPGAGPYTTGAVLSIAYGRPLPAVDGNVMRVFARLLRLQADPAAAPVRRHLEHLVAGLIPATEPGDFNQALMELGALVCLPKGPRCAVCPLAGLCAAHAAGEAEALPVKVRRQGETPLVPLLLAVVEAADGRVLVRRRPQSGLLAGLWEFPNWPAEAGPGGRTAAEATVLALLQRSLAELGVAEVGLAGLDGPAPRPLTTVRHAFSHLRWDIQAYWVRTEAAAGPPAGCRWVTRNELAELALPTPMARIAAVWAAASGGQGDRS